MSNLGLRLKHGHTALKNIGKKSREYNSWQNAKARCSNKNLAAYKDYGGRGISMCQHWYNSFAAFLEDMGPRPQGTSLDRFPNVNGNYEPGNCRWATRKQQVDNRRIKP